MLQEMECLRWCNKCSMPCKRFDHNIEFGGGGVWGRRRMRRRSKNSFPTFGAVVGPQARDKDKEAQTCERHFNYSIYGTSPRYMITHPRHPDLSKISHFTAKICLISRIQATMLSKTNHYAKPLRITMDSTSTFVHMQLT